MPIKVRFEQSPAKLTHVDPTERLIVTHVVHTFKGKPLFYGDFQHVLPRYYSIDILVI